MRMDMERISMFVGRKEKRRMYQNIFSHKQEQLLLIFQVRTLLWDLTVT